MTTKISSDNIQATTLATIGSGPKISQIQVCDSGYNTLDDTAVALGGGYIKITGTGFKTGATVTINRQQAISVTFISSTELRAQVAAETAGTYVVYVVNTDGSVALRVNGITFSSEPTWTTASTLPNGDSGAAISIQLVAAGATAYSVAGGSTLPTGLSLSSAGLLSGTITNTEETLYNFSIVATDTELQDSPRSFSITITVGDVYFNATTLLLTGRANTFVSDSSVNNLAITVAGDTKPSNFNPYLTGWSNFFDGSGDWLTVASTSAFGFGTGDYTVEFWLNLTAVPSSGSKYTLLDFRPTGGANPHTCYVHNSGGTLYLGFFNGTSDVTSSSQPLVANSWSHCVWARSGGTLRIFVNGVQAYSAANSTDYQSARPLTVGASLETASREPMTGYISNLRVVKGTAVYTANFTPSVTPLTAITNTSLLTCQSNRIIDNSTNNFTITRSGDVAIRGFSPFTESATTLGSGYFDGTGDFLTTATGTAVNFGTGDFTIEAWTYLTSLASFNGVFDSRTLGGTGTAITIFANGTVECGSGGAYVASAAVAFVTNQWNHVAFTRTGTTARVFVNGVQVASATHSVNYTATSALIGKTNDGFHCTGYISNVRVIKGTALYTANFTPPSASLTAVSGTSLLTLQNSVSHTNNQFADSSSNNLLVTRAGNATQGSFSPYSPSGWSNYFDGNGDNLATPANAAFQFGTGDFTVECWVNFTSTTGRQDIVWWGASGTDRGGIVYNELAGNLTYYISPTVARAINYAWTPSIGVWYHIALVRISGSSKLYVNGVQVSSTYADSKNYAGSNSVTVGKDNIAASSYFFGYVSNLRMIKGTGVYTSTFTPPTQPLTAIAGTSLLTCADNRFVDDSANNFVITRTGDVRTTNFSPFKAVTQTPVSYSTYFDGTGDSLTLSSTDVGPTGTENFTVEMSAYIITMGGTFPRLFEGAGNGNFQMYLDSGLLRVGGNGTGTVISYNIGSLVNQWIHICVTRSGTATRIFINGILRAYTNSDSTNYTSGSSWRSFNEAGGIVGYISNLRIVRGSVVNNYDTSSTTTGTFVFTPPTQPLTAISGTSLLTCQSATLVDNSANRFSITATGNTQPTQFNPFGATFVNSRGYTATEYSGSMYFDGTGDYVDLPNSSIFSQQGTWTLECWVYPTVAQNNYVYSQATPNFLQININASMVVNIDRSGVGNSIVSATPILLNAWTHLALVSDGTNLRLFINGTQSGSTVAVGTQAASAAVTRIGAYQSNGTLGFAGYISNLQLVKGTALYTANFVPPVAPVQPVPNTTLLLNGTSAGIVDATTKNNVETVGDVRVSNAVSKFGSSSMRFDGTGDYLTIPNNPLHANYAGNFTIECWFYLNSVAGTQTIVSHRNGTGGTNAFVPFIFWTEANALKIYVSSNNSSWNVVNGLTLATVVTGQWYHLAYTRSGSTCTVFVNGISVNSFTSSATFATTNSLQVGMTGPGETNSALNGYVQDLRITQGVARYTANFTPPASAFTTK